MKIVAAAALAATLAMGGPVDGHAKLLNTQPAADARLGTSPSTLTLTFNENVRLGTLRLSAAGHDIPLTFDRRNEASSMTVSLPALSSGRYDVSWSALTADDGHVVKGAYSFVVL